MTTRCPSLLLVAALGAGCADPAVRLPPEPAAFRADAEYRFGSATFGADTRAFTSLFDALRPRFGQLRIMRRSMDADVSPTQVRSHYDRHLTADGWVPLAEADVGNGPGRWSFGYAKGDRIIVVYGTTIPEGGRVPVTILTNLP